MKKLIMMDRGKPLDMKVRGPKVLPELNKVWSREHAEQAMQFARTREEARRKYNSRS